MKFVWLWRIAALVFVASLALVRLGDPLLLQTDEGFAANRALSLSVYHSTLVTYDDPMGPQFKKPPLLYWMVALLYRIIGFNTWAVRLPTAILSIGFCGLVYLINRRYFGEWIGLVSAALICWVPTCLFHTRTAMLEMPVLFFVLLSIYLLAYARPSFWVAGLAGLACVAGLMTKGAAALIALPAALILALIRRRFGRRTWWHVLVFFAAGIVPLIAYLQALPAPYADEFLFTLFHNSTSGRMSQIQISERWPALLVPLSCSLRWHLAAAGGGIILLIAAMRKNLRLLEWLVLALVLCVPTVAGGLKMANPYIRYFLIVFPFIVTLSVFFGFACPSSRRAAWLLLPFAISCPFVEQTIWGWIPAGVALLVLALAQWPRFNGWHLSRAVMSAALLMAVAIPSSFSALAWHEWEQPDRVKADPVAIRLAEKARDLLPEHGILVLGGSKFKAHDITFYSRRRCIGEVDWLREHFEAGTETIGIFRDGDIFGIPWVRTSVLEQDGPWKLLQIHTSAEAAGIRGIVIARARDRASMGVALNLLNVRFSDFPRGLAITGLPDCPDTPCPHDRFRQELVRVEDGVSEPWPEDGVVTLDDKHAVDIHFPDPVLLCGMDLIPISKHEVMTGVAIEVAHSPSGQWRQIQTVKDRFFLRFSIRDGRLRITNLRALRMRFAPTQTTRIRISKPDSEGMRLKRTEIYLADG